MISIILPTYNEAENISRLIDEIRRFSKANILVVDDNSPDGTANIAKKKKVHVIVNDKKLGLGHAYLQGMQYAIDNLKADVLIEMDSDFSHEPKYLKEFEKNILKRDIVIGSRYIKGGSIPKEWGIDRKFISVFGNKVISLFLGNISDWSTGFRAIRKEVFLDIKDKVKGYNGYTFQIAFLNEAVKSGYNVFEIPIHFKERTNGKSKFGMEYIVNTLKYILIDSKKQTLNKK